MAFYLSVIDPFLGLVLLRFEKESTVFTTSFDCVGGHTSICIWDTDWTSSSNVVS